MELFGAVGDKTLTYKSILLHCVFSTVIFNNITV